MSLRVEVDHSECVSSGACVLEAPEAFSFQEGSEALAVPLPGAAELPDERLIEVAELCPMMAIHVYDADGREVPLDGG
jgi:ferredoxin